MEPFNSIPVQKVDELPIDNLETIPEEYWEFMDIFSGEKVNTLAPHCPYDLQIELETGAKLTYRPIYSLSPPELSALQDFIEENTWKGQVSHLGAHQYSSQKRRMAVYGCVWTSEC